LPKRFLKPIKILKENRKKRITKNNKEGNKNQREAQQNSSFEEL